MERRFLSNKSASVELRGDATAPVIAGYAAVHYNGQPETEFLLWDTQSERAVERIAPGAFTKALTRGDDVRALFNHQESQLLGRTTAGTCKLSADGRGLYYEVTPGDTSVARDVVTFIKRKEVTGSSFAFTPDEEKWTETKDSDGKWQTIREIISCTLFDVSPCVYPAYSGATTGLRKSGEIDEARAALDKHRSSITLAAKIAGYRARAKLVGS